MITPPTPHDPLRLVLETTSEAPHEPESVVDAPLIAFEAFTARERLYGWTRLESDRLTDLLNAHPELRLVNVLRDRHGDGASTTEDEVHVRRRDLYAVQATGPRGARHLRRPTRLHPLVVQAGPYLIGGYLHASPGVDPEMEVQARPPMIPLTSAWIEYWVDGQRLDQWIGTILFNRELADRITVITEDELQFGQHVHRTLSRPG